MMEQPNWPIIKWKWCPACQQRAQAIHGLCIMCFAELVADIES